MKKESNRLTIIQFELANNKEVFNIMGLLISKSGEF